MKCRNKLPQSVRTTTKYLFFLTNRADKLCGFPQVYRLCVFASGSLMALLEYLISMNKMKVTTISTFPYCSHAFKSNLWFISQKSSYITLAENRTKFWAGIFLTHIFVKATGYIKMDFSIIMPFPFYCKPLCWILFAHMRFGKHFK